MENTIKKIMTNENQIREFHLFAGIGGGIYGGQLLGHKCVGACEIGEYQQKVLRQRQKDGWMDEFPIYSDIRELNGADFKDKFDVLCGGFPCQAFSRAAHGLNKKEKNIWPEMLRFIKESVAPVVFGENVAEKAIVQAKKDLENLGYDCNYVKLGCSGLGGDHKRTRFWIMGIRDASEGTNKKLSSMMIASLKLNNGKRLSGTQWTRDLNNDVEIERIPFAGRKKRDNRFLGTGNAQSPFVAATAFQMLVFKFLDLHKDVDFFFEKKETWIHKNFPDLPGPIHTPTTMANYSCPYMTDKKAWPCCVAYKTVFGQPTPEQAEYLLGFPLGASTVDPVSMHNYNLWKKDAGIL